MGKFRVCTLIITIAMVPQVGDAGWNHLYGPGRGYCVQVTNTGNFIVTGSRELWNDSFEWTFENVLILEVESATGTVLWEKTYGDTTTTDCAFGLDNTSDGGYIMVGEIYKPDSNDRDIWLLKMDVNGDTLWTRVFGGESLDVGHSVRETPDGGYIISGYTCSYGTLDGWADIWLLRTNPAGDTLWTRKYDSGGIDDSYSVEPTDDGDYILSSRRGIMKVNAFGDSIWSCVYEKNEIFCVLQTTDGNYIMAGGYGYNLSDLILRKVDSYGNSIWEKKYRVSDSIAGYARDVKETEDGGYVIVGATDEELDYGNRNYDLWLLKTNASGDTLWTQIFDGRFWESGNCIQITKDGGYVITGVENASLWFRGDLWLLKTDSLGFIAIEEPKPQPNIQVDWKIDIPVSRLIELSYSGSPSGFYAHVFDASGRKVDEIHLTSESGTVTWGEGFSQGVYFVRPMSHSGTAQKVILVR